PEFERWLHSRRPLRRTHHCLELVLELQYQVPAQLHQRSAHCSCRCGERQRPGLCYSRRTGVLTVAPTQLSRSAKGFLIVRLAYDSLPLEDNHQQAEADRASTT